jgi:hypothetical protein
LKNLNRQAGHKILKAWQKLPISCLKLRTVPEKGKLLERAGRKITGLKPCGQGSGIAEEDHPLVNSENPHRKARSVALGTRKARERLTGSQGFEAFSNHMVKKEWKK